MCGTDYTHLYLFKLSSIYTEYKSIVTEHTALYVKHTVKYVIQLNSYIPLNKYLFVNLVSANMR